MIQDCKYCGIGHPESQCPIVARHAEDAVKPTISGQSARPCQDRHKPRDHHAVAEAVHEIQKDKEPCIMEKKNSARTFDLVNIRYLNFDNIKSLIFTNVEFSNSQK